MCFQFQRTNSVWCCQFCSGFGRNLMERGDQHEESSFQTEVGSFFPFHFYFVFVLWGTWISSCFVTRKLIEILGTCMKWWTMQIQSQTWTQEQGISSLLLLSPIKIIMIKTNKVMWSPWKVFCLYFLTSGLVHDDWEILVPNFSSVQPLCWVTSALNVNFHVLFANLWLWQCSV